MTGFELFVTFGFIYCVADFVFGIALKRCVLPGLRCKICREVKT